MKLKRKHLLFLLLVCVVAVLLYAYREYNRKPASLLSLEPIASIDAASLITSYATDEQKANNMYLGKPIDVAGVISEIDNQRDTLVNIVLGKAEDMHRVSCLLDLQNAGKIKAYKTGDKIRLRGICTGYLMDVELNRCVIIE